MEIDPEVRLAQPKRILALIAQKCGSIVSIRKLSLVSAGDEDVFGFADVLLVNNEVQIAKFPERCLPVQRLCQNGTLEGHDRNTIFLKLTEQPQKFRGKKQALL